MSIQHQLHSIWEASASLKSVNLERSHNLQVLSIKLTFTDRKKLGISIDFKKNVLGDLGKQKRGLTENVSGQFPWKHLVESEVVAAHCMTNVWDALDAVQLQFWNAKTAEGCGLQIELHDYLRFYLIAYEPQTMPGAFPVMTKAKRW